MKDACRAILRWAYCLLLALMPFYWCAPAVPVETANFPMSFLEGLLTTMLPLPLFGVAVGLLLLATALLWPPRRQCLDAAATIPLLALLPLVAGLAGLVNTTEWSFAGNWMLHFGSIAAFAAGVWLASRHDRQLLPWLCNVLAFTAAIAAVHGWQQHFGGLQANYEMQLQNAAEQGTPLTEAFLQKLRQTRSYGSFCDPNVYAAQLLVAGPFLLLALHRLAGRCVAAQRLAATALLLGGGVILLGGAIYFSGSRGAMVGAAAGLALYGWQLWGRRLRWTHILALAAAVALLLSAGLVVLSLRTSRRLETAGVRTEYYQCAWRIFLRHPLCGAGLGEFQNWHLRLKPWSGDEARDPHSFLFAQLSQCGIPGGAEALLRLLAPLALALGCWRRRRCRDMLQGAVAIAAWSAWTIHALLQFNDLITATAATAACCGLFALEDGHAGGAEDKVAAVGWPGWTLSAAGAALLAISLWQLPGWRHLQELDNLMRDRYARPQAVAEALSAAAGRYRHSLLPVRMLCDYCAPRPELQEQGLAAAREYVLRAPHRPSARLRLAGFAIRRDDLPGAQEALDQAAQWYPGSPGVLLLRGILALEHTTAQERAAMSLWSAIRIPTGEEERRIQLLIHTPPGDRLGRAFAERQLPRLNALRMPAPDGAAAPVVFTLD